MLAKFSVTNFKSFNKKFELDLQDTNGYVFNKECIRNGIVNCALIYGHNGVGKSNLGLAIFDIIGHMTDHQTNDSLFLNYLNAYNGNKFACFSYEFVFDECNVKYEYKKSDYRTIIYEKLTINSEELAIIDRTASDEAIIKLKGAESLKNIISNRNLSLLKYIKNNSILEKNRENSCFLKLFEFVEGLLFFSSLRNNVFLGVESGGSDVAADIIEKGKLEDFESFLNRAGVDCKLGTVTESDKKVLAFDFGAKMISFNTIASSGTMSLMLFYYWLQRLLDNQVSFLYIDEFDAFYHHELSALIVDELKRVGIQFILTSHNTSIITNDLLRPDCYFLMKRDSVKSLAKRTRKELREAHNIEKMYKAGSFNG